MAIALVASAKSSGRLSPGASTSGSANASGANLGVLVLCWYNGPTPTWAITDNSGGSNTWTQRLKTTSSAPFGFAIYDCQGGTFVNGMTVTVTGTAGADIAFSFGWAAYSGVASSSPVDGTPAGHASASHTSTIQSGAVTTTQTGDLLVAGLLISDNQTGVPGSITIDNSFTIEQQLNWTTGVCEGHALADLIWGSSGSMNPTWSGLNGTIENIAGLIAYKAASTGITGSAAWTEAQDTWAGAGGVQDNGTAAWIEVKDTWAGIGTVLVSGTAAWTEAPDTWAGAGGVLVSGSAAWTEAQDTWAGAGTVASGVTGTAAWTEAQDTWAGAGTVLVSGAAAWIEGPDIWSGAGTVTLPTITGTGAWTERQDTWSGQGTNGVTLIDLDAGKRKKRANKRRDKELADDRAKNERRRAKVLDAFERAFEGEVDLPEPALEEMVLAIEKQENIPNGPNLDAILANVSNIEALWREYLDRDDEEVLLLL